MNSVNRLAHKAAFHKVLEHYQLSDDALNTLHKTNLVLLVAPSAGGRNTIINELVKTGDYRYIVSDTTRKPRLNNGVLEQNGIEYWFREEADMLHDLEAGEFLEAEVIHEQQVSGISIRELALASSAHKIAITDVDIGGIDNVLRLKPDTIAILVLPPSFSEWQKRFRLRGSIPKSEEKHRLETAIRIFETALKDNYLKIVINEKLATAIKQVDLLARGSTPSDAEQRAAQQQIKQLLDDTRAYLANMQDS